jgi:hypothetical protein
VKLDGEGLGDREVSISSGVATPFPLLDLTEADVLDLRTALPVLSSISSTYAGFPFGLSGMPPPLNLKVGVTASESEIPFEPDPKRDGFGIFAFPADLSKSGVGVGSMTSKAPLTDFPSESGGAAFDA